MGCVWPAAPSKITYYMRECLILSLPPTTLLLPQLPTASTSTSTSYMMITHLTTHPHHHLRSHTPLDRLFALLCLRIGRFHIPSTCRGELWMLTFHKYDVPMMMMMITHGYGVVPPLQEWLATAAMNGGRRYDFRRFMALWKGGVGVISRSRAIHGLPLAPFDFPAIQREWLWDRWTLPMYGPWCID